MNAPTSSGRLESAGRTGEVLTRKANPLRQSLVVSGGGHAIAACDSWITTSPVMIRNGISRTRTSPPTKTMRRCCCQVSQIMGCAPLCSLHFPLSSALAHAQAQPRPPGQDQARLWVGQIGQDELLQCD